ncbi:hypothetical protein ACQKQC_06395 [Vibrio fortis]|uniref:hypothetical protein n=1 Tax=Vibrio fortis TaxID=212667 RepID=UPI004067967E
MTVKDVTDFLSQFLTGPFKLSLYVLMFFAILYGFNHRRRLWQKFKKQTRNLQSHTAGETMQGANSSVIETETNTLASILTDVAIFTAFIGFCLWANNSTSTSHPQTNPIFENQIVINFGTYQELHYWDGHKKSTCHITLGTTLTSNKALFQKGKPANSDFEGRMFVSIETPKDHNVIAYMAKETSIFNAVLQKEFNSDRCVSGEYVVSTVQMDELIANPTLDNVLLYPAPNGYFEDKSPLDPDTNI